MLIYYVFLFNILPIICIFALAIVPNNLITYLLWINLILFLLGNRFKFFWLVFLFIFLMFFVLNLLIILQNYLNYKKFCLILFMVHLKILLQRPNLNKVGSFIDVYRNTISLNDNLEFDYNSVVKVLRILYPYSDLIINFTLL